MKTQLLHLVRLALCDGWSRNFIDNTSASMASPDWLGGHVNLFQEAEDDWFEEFDKA